jgi:cell division protein FtsL
LTVRQNLTIEMARLKSPDRIEKIAREQLGMQTPSPEQIIVIP